MTAATIVAFAGYRLWRLIGRDTITESLRARLSPRVRDPLECGWCAGTWITLAVAVAAWGYLPEPRLFAALAAAAVAGLISERA